MSSNKRDDSLTKRKTSPEKEREVKATATSESKDKKKSAQGAQPSGGFKAGWLVGGSLLILAIALLYTRNVEEGAQKKDHPSHPVRDTEQIQINSVTEQEADNKGLLLVQEKWKNVFKVEKLGSAITLHTLRCTSEGPDAYDVVLPKVVQDIGENINVKSFTLKTPNCKSFSDYGLIGLSENIGKYLSKVESLDLAFLEHPYIGDVGFKSLASSISQNLHNLQHLSLALQVCITISGDSLSHLASTMDKFPRSFQNFSLTVTVAPRLTTLSVVELAQSLGRNFPNLAHLKISLVRCEQLTNSAIDGISNTIGANLKNLESLSLIFSAVGGISTDEIRLITDNTIGLKKLRRLELNFQKSKIETESLEVLGKAFEKYSALSELILDISGSRAVYDDGIKHLVRGLKNQKNLRILDLNLFGLEQITDEGAKALAVIFNEDHKGLEEVSLELSYSKLITDVGMIAIAKNIEQNLPNLKKLKLQTPMNDQQNDAVGKQMGAIFSPKHQSLREVSLSHKPTNALSDEGISVMAENIGNNLVNLEKLSWDFGSIKNMADQSFTKIAEAVSKRLPKLQELDLRFADVKPTAAGVAALIESLGQSNPDLKFLSLGFEGIAAVTDDMILQLTNTIGTHFKGLEKLAFAFTLSKAISNKGVKHIENMVLTQLPNIRDVSLKFYKSSVSNSALSEFAINIAKKNSSINRLTIGFTQVDAQEKAALKEKTKAIPFFP